MSDFDTNVQVQIDYLLVSTGLTTLIIGPQIMSWYGLYFGPIAVSYVATYIRPQYPRAAHFIFCLDHNKPTSPCLRSPITHSRLRTLPAFRPHGASTAVPSPPTHFSEQSPQSSVHNRRRCSHIQKPESHFPVELNHRSAAMEMRIAFADFSISLSLRLRFLDFAMVQIPRSRKNLETVWSLRGFLCKGTIRVRLLFQSSQREFIIFLKKLESQISMIMSSQILIYKDQ